MWLISYLGKKENGLIIHLTPCPSYEGALLIVLLESDVEWLGKILKDKADCYCFFALVD